MVIVVRIWKGQKSLKVKTGLAQILKIFEIVQILPTFMGA